jgi:general secretion pathway protein K
MPDQAPVLAMLAPGRISLASARAAIAQRPAKGWTNIADFWATGRLPAPARCRRR